VKAYVVGRGAVGTFLGDRLASIGVDVAYAPRELGAVEPVEADVAIVATKAYDTQGAIETLHRALRAPETCVFVTPQNGIGNEEALAAAFGARNVVAAALTVPVGVDADGRGTAANEGGLAFAPVGESAFNWLVATFASSGIAVGVVDDYRALKWSKLALNIVANASCAILDVLPGRVVGMPEVFALEIAAIRETRAVMRAMAVKPIDLPRYPVRALFAIAALPPAIGRRVLAGRIARGRGEKPPSLLLDVRAGNRRSEVAYLNGAVAAAGARLGVPTPANALFAATLEAIAHDPQLRERYRNNPDALTGARKHAS